MVCFAEVREWDDASGRVLMNGSWLVALLLVIS